VKTFRLTLALILALIGATGLCTAQSGSTTLDDLTARIEQSPSAALYAARAAERVKMGDAKNAIADFNRALEISPDDFSLHLARADQYAATGDPKSALADRDRAVHLKPDVAGTHLARADSYLQLGMRDEEMADRDETIRLAPDWPEAWLARGRSYFLRGEYSTALGDLNKVLDLKPDQAEARLLLGTTKLQAHDHEDALADLLKAIAFNDRLPGAHARLGELLLAMGEIARAAAAFRQELALDPADFVSNLNMGVLAKQDQEYADARLYLERALKSRPGDPGVRYQLALLDLATGGVDQARKALETLIAESPNFAEVHGTLATVYYRLNLAAEGDHERAITQRLTDERQEAQRRALSRANQPRESQPR